MVFKIYLLDHGLSVFELTLGTFDAFEAKVYHKAIKMDQKNAVFSASD